MNAETTKKSRIYAITLLVKTLAILSPNKLLEPDLLLVPQEFSHHQ